MKLLQFGFVGLLTASLCWADGPLPKGATEAVNKTNANGVVRAMERIVVPEVEFRDASLRCVVDFLDKIGRENDPDRKGVKISLCAPANVPDEDCEQKAPMVTLSARGITLAAAVELVSAIAGVEGCIDETGVRLMLPEVPAGELRLRGYTVGSAFLEDLMSAGFVGSNVSVSVDGLLRCSFSRMGVKWPRGSSVTYDATRHEVLVQNTDENLVVLDRLLLLERDVRSSQVEIEMLFIEFNLTNVAHLAPGRVDAKSLLQAWTNGTGRLLAAPRIITRSGAEASVRGVTEVIYPTSFLATCGSGGMTNSACTGACEVAVASDFQTREVGAILTVLPEISPDGDAINLTMSPAYVEPPIWKDYGYDLPADGGKLRHVPNEQPFFGMCSFSTQVSVKDGATVLVGGGVPTRDGKGIVYCFLTARLVGLDGEPIRKQTDSRVEPIR